MWIEGISAVVFLANWKVTFFLAGLAVSISRSASLAPAGRWYIVTRMPESLKTATRALRTSLTSSMSLPDPSSGTAREVSDLACRQLFREVRLLMREASEGLSLYLKREQKLAAEVKRELRAGVMIGNYERELGRELASKVVVIRNSGSKEQERSGKARKEE